MFSFRDRIICCIKGTGRTDSPYYTNSLSNPKEVTLYFIRLLSDGVVRSKGRKRT